MPPKKDKKKDKEAKKEAKKLRQTAKADKAANKRTKKELKEAGEEDLEAIIAGFQTRDSKRTAVNITSCRQPSPRSNFSLTTLPSGELLLFGGEICDGEGTTVFNELYRFNLEKLTWKIVESINAPPPRCSHQVDIYMYIYTYIYIYIYIYLISLSICIYT